MSVSVCNIVFVDLFIVILSVKVLLIVFFVIILCGLIFFLIKIFNFFVVCLINFLCFGLIVKIFLLLGRVKFNILYK